MGSGNTLVRFIILAHPGDHTAVCVASALRRHHGPHAVRLVSVDEILLAPRWVHCVGAKGVDTTVELHDGTALHSASIGVVFNRLNYVDAAHFAHAPAADKDYAAMELFALLLSWLAGLPCPVINRPSPAGLGGAVQTLQDWLLLAVRAGLAVPNMRFTSNARRFARAGWQPVEGPWDVSIDEREPWPTGLVRAQPAWLAPDACAPTGARHSVFLVEGEPVGEVPSTLVGACRKLAALCDAELLRLDFTDSPLGDDRWSFVGADMRPEITSGATLAALIQCLERRAEVAA